MLTAQDLAAVMKCNQSPSSTASKPVWKLFLSKASGVLDAALDLLANTVQKLDLNKTQIKLLIVLCKSYNEQLLKLSKIKGR